MNRTFLLAAVQPLDTATIQGAVKAADIDIPGDLSPEKLLATVDPRAFVAS